MQGLLSLQTIAVPTQAPSTQASVVHALLSEHGFVLSLVKTHPVAGLHESSVQTLLSLQTIAVLTHWPAAQEAKMAISSLS